MLRRLFLWHDPLPVSADGLSDASMAPTVAEAKARAKKLVFPSTFFFGCATAAYQIEGGLDNCNWSMWECAAAGSRSYDLWESTLLPALTLYNRARREQRTRKSDGQPTVEGHQRAGLACDSWNRFDEDLAALKALGARMYRFSVEWSRIEPREGVINEAALSRYHSWCQQLRAAGIEPHITLHHFSEPAWFVKMGGWEKRANVDHFERFATVVGTRLAPVCGYWTTINEANGYALCGWLAGVHPPGIKDELGKMLKVVRHLLVAHTRAYHAIHTASTTAGASAQVCLGLNHVWHVPNAWYNLLSVVLCLFLNVVYNFVMLDAILLGRFPNFPIPFQLIALAFGWGRDIRALHGTAEFIGVNHYYRSIVRFGFRDSSMPSLPSPTDMFIQLPLGLLLRGASVPGFEKNEMGWDLTPSSMEVLLRAMWERYRAPILITESGTADGAVPDQKRTRYVAAILEEIARVRDVDGADVRGCLIWTLLDNFEWAEGYRPKFGLLSTNFETLERTERKATCDMLRSIFKREAAPTASASPSTRAQRSPKRNRR